MDPVELRGGVTDRESWTDVAWEDILGESTSEEQETGLECTRGQAQKREMTWEEEENMADWVSEQAVEIENCWKAPQKKLSITSVD